MSLNKYLAERVIDKTVREKLIEKLHEVSQVIDEMGHTPSRLCLDEMIVLIHIKLKEFDNN